MTKLCRIKRDHPVNFYITVYCTGVTSSGLYCVRFGCCELMSCPVCTVYCTGVTSSGLYCVRFGLVTADTDLEELIAMVYAHGKEVEESSKVCAVSL